MQIFKVCTLNSVEKLLKFEQKCILASTMCQRLTSILYFPVLYYCLAILAKTP